MKRMRVILWALLAATAAGSAAAAAAASMIGLGAMGAQPGGPQRIAFQIMTGSTGGTYYPLGELLAGIISHPPGVARCEDEARCGPPGLIATARASQGSVENARAVAARRAASGLVQADIAAAARAGRAPFEAPLENLRAIAALYPEMVHLIARSDAGIAQVSDLRNKRVAIGAPGSGTNATARAVLQAFAVAPWRVKLNEEPVDVAVRMLKSGEADALFFVGGAPVPLIADLARSGGITLVPIAARGRENLIAGERAYLPAVLAEGLYPGLPETETIAVGALWLVSADETDGLVHAVTRALFNPENRAALERGHAQGAQMSLETALDGLTVPLHPGAERFYREAGVLTEAGLPPSAPAN